MKTKRKLVTIVIRDCIFLVEPSRAGELVALEREMVRREWATNTLP